MFRILNIFKRKKETEVSFDKQRFATLIEAFPHPYDRFAEQINEGIVTRAILHTELPHYEVELRYDVPLLNKYERKREPQIILRGIEVFDTIRGDWIEVRIRCNCGLVREYWTENSKEFEPDWTRFRVNGFRAESPDQKVVTEMRKYLKRSDIDLLNPSDFYEVELPDAVYFHLVDLEDGDFIGVGKDKKFYHVTHDPLEATRLEGTLEEILERYGL